MFTQIKTISNQILSYLKRHRKWVSVRELEDIVIGHSGSSVSRIARYLAENGDIKRDYKKVVKEIKPLVFYKI